MSETPPDNLRYTKDHEWARLENDDVIIVGITGHAVEQLGDITMVTLPDEGTSVKKGETFGDVDSVKAVSELYAPVSGEIVGKNPNLEDQPELVNAEPYAQGWMLKIKLADRNELDQLMSAEDYGKYLDELD